MRKLYLTLLNGQKVLRPAEEIVKHQLPYFINKDHRRSKVDLQIASYSVVGNPSINPSAIDYGLLHALTHTTPNIPQSNMYVEPSNPWTAYPWVNGTLSVTDSYLNANGVLLTTGKWAGYWMVYGLSRRNMVMNQRAISIETKRKVLFKQCNIMGIWGTGSGMAAIGSSTGDARWQLEDCSLYGPGLNMADGLSAGGLSAEYFRRLGVSQTNFVGGAKGAQTGRIRAAQEETDGFYFENNRMMNVDGRIRDSLSPTGYSQSNDLGVGWRRTQAVQVNGHDGADHNTTIRTAWNWISSEPYTVNGILTAAYIDDTVNYHSLSTPSDKPAIIEYTMVDGAYSHILQPSAAYPNGAAFSGGGMMLGDGSGLNQLMRMCVALETSNYGLAVSSGNYMTIEDSIALATGVLPDGTRIDPIDPDAGLYMRHYGIPLSEVMPETRIARRNLVRWSRKSSNGSMFRSDISVDAGRGTLINNVTTPSGVVTASDLSQARATFFGWAQSAGQTFGRRAAT